MRPSAFTNRPAYESKFLPNNYNLNQLRVSGWYAPLGTLVNAPENFTLYDLFVIAPNPDIYATQMAFGISYRMVEVSSTEGDVDIVQNEIVQDKNGNIVYTHRRAGVDEDDDGTPDYNDMIMTVGADSFNVLRIVTDDSLPLDVTISENLGKETSLNDLKKYINKKVADISKDEIVHSNGDSSLSNIGEIGKMVFTDDNGNVYSLDDMSTNHTTADVSIKDDVITAKIHKNDGFENEIVVNANDFSNDDNEDETINKTESQELLDTLDNNYSTIYLDKDKTTNYLTTLGEAEAKQVEDNDADRLVVRPKAIVDEDAELVILNRSAVYVRSYVNGAWTSWVILGQSNTASPSNSSSTSTDDDDDEGTNVSVNFEKIYSYIDTKLSFESLLQGTDLYGMQVEISGSYNFAPYDEDSNVFETSASGIEYDRVTDLPPEGNPEKLYIVKSENSIYRYDDELGKFVCCGRDWKTITKIISDDFDPETISSDDDDDDGLIIISSESQNDNVVSSNEESNDELDQIFNEDFDNHLFSKEMEITASEIQDALNNASEEVRPRLKRSIRRQLNKALRIQKKRYIQLN